MVYDISFVEVMLFEVFIDVKKMFGKVKVFEDIECNLFGYSKIIIGVFVLGEVMVKSI